MKLLSVIATAVIHTIAWPHLATAQFTAVRLQANTSTVSAEVYAIRNGVIGGNAPNPNTQPVLWQSAASPFVSLSPNGLLGGRVLALSDTHQFGSLGGQAAMWSGTPESYVNLHPAWGPSNSAVLASSSTHQGGWVNAFTPTAALWSGSASSAISLAPSGSTQSQVNAMTETRQGGYAVFPGLSGHAGIWGGSAASFIDLHPIGHTVSNVLGMFGDQQVGVAQASGAGSFPRAAMWNGTAQSFRIMHPFADGLSFMNATCGSAQVGYVNATAFGGGGVRAAIWFGTAGSVLDLSQFLPPGHFQSIATCVEERDGVITVGGIVRYGDNDEAFVWVGVPSPGAACVMMCAGVWAGRRRRVG